MTSAAIPGGVLVEAVSVCDKLLNRGQIIVSQRGRAYPEQVYRATHVIRVISSPSLSLSIAAPRRRRKSSPERSRTTTALLLSAKLLSARYGSDAYRLSDNTGLALTTYHYYTPSGRLIQRNYDGVSLYDYYYNHDQSQGLKNREVKLTDSGRTVYGAGGGITPDYKIEPPTSNHFQDVLDAHNVFFNFTRHYLANRTVGKDFEVSNAVLDH